MLMIFAQKNEFSAGINTNFMYFTGSSAEDKTFINYTESSQTSYTNNPYGSKSGIGIGFNLSYKRITKSKLFVGIEASYQNSKSKIDIQNIYVFGDDFAYMDTASGTTNLVNNTLNINPFIGYRKQFQKFNLDIGLGLEISNIISTKEKGSATDIYNKQYKTNRDRKTISTDFLPKIQLNAYYKNYGMFCNYSFGLANYKANYDGGNNEAYSRIFCIGINYRLK